MTLTRGLSKANPPNSSRSERAPPTMGHADAAVAGIGGPGAPPHRSGFDLEDDRRLDMVLEIGPGRAPR